MPRASLTNVRRYLPFQVSAGIYAWMPVFFLYFSSILDLRDVLLLEAIYYAAVVILEVPSGYFSDRFGRTTTLRIAAGLLVIAYALFATGAGFITLACAQVALAAGLAFQSGTDTSFHYDSLEDAGIDGEYGDREARIAGWLLVTGALAGVAGGALGLIDFRLAYGLSGIGALCAFFIAWTFQEPSRQPTPGERPIGSFSESLSEIRNYLNQRPLRWIFIFFVAATAINHIPYEFYQPILRDLDVSIGAHTFAAYAPLIAGMHLAAAQLIAAPFAGFSQRMAATFGTVRWLLASFVLQSTLIAAMALWVHPGIALLLLARSIPSSMQRAPIRAAVTPRIRKEHRATYHSVMSLAGRLAFASLLASLAFAENLTLMGVTGLQLCLSICTVLCLITCAGLALTSLRPARSLADHP